MSKARNMMYVQRMAYLPFKTLAEGMDRISKKLQPQRCAGILHDQDVYTQEEKDAWEAQQGTPFPHQIGEKKAAHVHIMMQFEHPRSLKQVAKLLEDSPQYLQQWQGNYKNGFAYLIHATTNACHQHLYDVTEVLANFDYPTLIKQMTQEVTESTRQTSRKDAILIRQLLDQLGNGDLTKEEVIAQLTGSQFAKAKKQINDVYQQVQAEKAKSWLAARKESNEPILVIWLYGQSETGKTLLAKNYARTIQTDYFITGSSKDSFQQYNGEHVVILDELRPKTFPYDDLLKMLDPYGENPKAPSRFFDKSLMVDVFIITTPYNPKQFYDAIFGQKKTPDAFKQLERRITFVQYMTAETIERQEYHASLGTYVPVVGTQKKNTLFDQLSQHTPHNGQAMYEKFTQFLTKPMTEGDQTDGNNE
ncbi:TPA: Rep family protein [Enterococcus faecalis]